MAAMTAGIGNFSASSISTISKDLRALLSTKGNVYYVDPDNVTMEQVAAQARKYFFEERFSQLGTKPAGNFQYWIGGYSSRADLGEIWRFQIDNGLCGGAICDAAQNNNSNISWSGPCGRRHCERSRSASHQRNWPVYSGRPSQPRHAHYRCCRSREISGRDNQAVCSASTRLQRRWRQHRHCDHCKA